ncbi:MAG TPA: type II toxin-antitoxin system VapC family toxin [Acidobacteriaceae bacterium]|nr:type II toxin-antitoxin system VapC family toxin [Acidobacteriaceae bacterium]
MNVLLDTHTLVWAVLSPPKLSKAAAYVVADPTIEIFVSAASAWEIATKVRLGKFPEAIPFEGRFLDTVAEAGYTLLSIEPETALRAGRLIADHGDPFDRIIAAQALALDIPVISKDQQLDQFNIRRIW